MHKLPRKVIDAAGRRPKGNTTGRTLFALPYSGCRESFTAWSMRYAYIIEHRCMNLHTIIFGNVFGLAKFSAT